jgi:hypothetical protein
MRTIAEIVEEVAGRSKIALSDWPGARAFAEEVGLVVLGEAILDRKPSAADEALETAVTGRRRVRGS